MASDGTDVSPDSVSDFGKKSLDQAKAFMSGTGDSIGSIGSARPGASGMAEAASFAAAHSRNVQAMGMFAKDAATGLQALGYGGLTIADNYRNADISQAAQMKSVDAAFNPGAGTPSIASDRAAAQEAPARAPKDLPKPVPAAAQIPASYDGIDTPQEQVDRHNQRFGENETWRPKDGARDGNATDWLNSVGRALGRMHD